MRLSKLSLISGKNAKMFSKLLEINFKGKLKD